MNISSRIKGTFNSKTVLFSKQQFDTVINIFQCYSAVRRFLLLPDEIPVMKRTKRQLFSDLLKKLFTHADTVIAYGYNKTAFRCYNANDKISLSSSAFKSVNNRIFHNGLQRKLRYSACKNTAAVIIINAYIKMKTFSKPVLLYKKIIFCIIKFHAERKQIFYSADRISEKSGKSFSHIGYRIKSRGQCFRSHTFQRIIQKMRINLSLQDKKLRLPFR